MDRFHNDIPNLPPQQLLHHFLKSHESLLWEGGPAKPRLFSKDNLWSFLLGLVLIVVSLFLFFGNGSDSASRFPFHGTVLLIGGIVVAVGLPLRFIWILSHSWFGVTDQRVILISMNAVTFLPYEDIPCVEEESNGDGTYTLYLELLNVYHGLRGRIYPYTWHSNRHYRAAIVNIPDGPEVAKLIRSKLREVSLD